MKFTRYADQKTIDDMTGPGDPTPNEMELVFLRRNPAYYGVNNHKLPYEYKMEIKITRTNDISRFGMLILSIKRAYMAFIRELKR